MGRGGGGSTRRAKIKSDIESESIICTVEGRGRTNKWRRKLEEAFDAGERRDREKGQ
jgi:hypothetical protein